MKKAWVLLLCIMLFLTGCQTPAAIEIFFAMDTINRIEIYGQDNSSAKTDVVAKIYALDNLLSKAHEDSEIWRINHADTFPVSLSQELQNLLQLGQQYSIKTQGAFDMTLYPLISLWGIGTDSQRVPSLQEIRQAHQITGYTHMQISEEGLIFDQIGMGLDLGAIGKGYAADECVKLLREREIDTALLSLGGNIYALGHKPGGQPWQIGIADPQNTNQALGIIKATDTAVVTSGDYERYFEEGGKRYHHILDPLTGYPTQSDLRSVTIVSDNATLADIYATALYVMGREKALTFWEQEGNFEVVLVDKENHVYYTKGLEGLFVLMDNETYSAILYE